MIERAISLPELGPEDGRPYGRPQVGDRLTLQPRTIRIIAVTAALLIGFRLLVSEGGPATTLFAALVCATTGAIVLLVTRRVLVATALLSAQVLLVSVTSSLKLKYMNMVLHAYDLAYYLPSTSTLSFLWESYRSHVVSTILALLLTALVTAFAYRVDPTRVSRTRAAGAVVVFGIGAWAAAGATGERRHSQFEYEGMYLTNFYLSWSETIETLWRGQLLEAAAESAGSPLRPSNLCEPTVKPPHIILIHHESAAPPSLFQKLDYDRRVDSFFRSDNGQSYKLRVETYGGASTLTEFSVLTGLSTYAFGGMRQFVQKLMAGKIKETLPQTLTRCGYRNVLFYPMLKTFTFADRFFKGAGIDEIFDLKHQKAQRVNERDRFYYNNALDEIERHIASTERPLFAFIETMATHWPYDHSYEPQLTVPGGGRGTHPEMHEYLRRLWIAHMDYDYLRETLERRFPGEQFLIVRYGDHQPMATRVLLGFDEDTEAEDVLVGRDSIGFLTFFAVNGVNFAPRGFVSPPILDVPYLGTVLLEAAGLPLSDAYKERQVLKEICEGLSFGCRHRDRVLGFHRQLLDSGLVSAR